MPRKVDKRKKYTPLKTFAPADRAAILSHFLRLDESQEVAS